MNLDDYQDWADSTARPSTRDMTYLTAALASEAGEVNGHWAKALRGDYGREEMERLVMPELGDILWNVAMIAKNLGVPLSEVVDYNIEKITDRMARNVVEGSGDFR